MTIRGLNTFATKYILMPKPPQVTLGTAKGRLQVEAGKPGGNKRLVCFDR